MKRSRRRLLPFALSIVLAVTLTVGRGDGRTATQGAERWVSTWATAQQLDVPMARGVGPAPVTPSPSSSSSSDIQTRPAVAGTSPQQPTPAFTGQGRSGRGGGPAANIPTTLSDQTIRMVVRSSIGSRRIRVALSNMLNTQPLQIGAAHIARHSGNDAI